MRKLFDFSGCYGSAPAEPGAGSTDKDWSEFHRSYEKWYYTCLAGLQPVSYPPSLPPPDEFQDTKGNTWIRTVSSRTIDFKLDLFSVTRKSLSLGQSGSLRIIAISMPSTGDYSIVTLGQDGIKTQKLKPKKTKLAKLLKAIASNSKIPATDLNKMTKEFWDKLK